MIPEGGTMGAAGHRHMILCLYCRTRDEDDICTCEEPCNWIECRISGDRRGPLDYVKPPVPVFRPERTEEDKP